MTSEACDTLDFRTKDGKKHTQRVNPFAMLRLPVVSLKRAFRPTAAFYNPLVRQKSALVSSAVFPPG
jgi:hypothetical protein